MSWNQCKLPARALPDRPTDFGLIKPGLKKPAIWFRIVSVMALLWYVMDALAFAMRVTLNDASLANMPEHQQQFIKNLPTWVHIVFAFEVFGGLLGSAALLIRWNTALILFVVSLSGVLCQTFYIWFLSGQVQLMGTIAITMPLVAIVISLIMIFISSLAAKRGWLR